MELVKLDPRTKLVIVFSLSTLAVFVKNIYLLFLVLIVSISIAYYFRRNLDFIRKARKFIILFIGIAFIQSIFSPAGTTLFAIGKLSILTTGGQVKGIRVILRMLIIIISATIMTTSGSREIIQGLIQWKIPYEIAFMVSLAVRFLPILAEEARDVYIAIQLRGIEIDKLSLGKRFQIYSYLFMPILSGVIFKARELSTSIEARAFRAYPERTSFIKLQMVRSDYLVIFLSLTFTAAILYINLIN